MNSAASWQVAADHPALAGHFPGTPILPGVMLLDAVMHLLAGAGVTLDTCEIRAVKFSSPAAPGDVLTLQQHQRADGAIRFEIVAGSRTIAAGEIVPGPHVPAPQRPTP